MAINPFVEYPGKITPPDADYIYGSARNVTVPGDGTGTPWLASFTNDVFGFQQAILSKSGIVPSGSPDKVTASQYMEALQAITGVEFSTLAAMVADLTLNPGNIVGTSGRTAVRDAGGINYEIVASGGDIVLDNGSEATIIHNGVIPGKALNLVGDGTTDDSVAIADCLSAATGFSTLTRTIGVQTRVPTIQIPGGTYYFKTPQIIPNYCNLDFHEDALFLFDDVDHLGEYAFTNGDPGVAGGLFTVTNFNIYLFSVTAKALDLLNCRRAKFHNVYCQGKILDDWMSNEAGMSARTNTALRIRTDASLDSFFNEFYNFESNHCHFGVTYDKGAINPTQQVFHSFKFFGDSIFNDRAAIGYDSGDGGGADARIHSGYIEGVGNDGIGIRVKDVAGFECSGMIYDSTEDCTAIRIEGTSSFCKFRGGRIGPKGAVQILSPPENQNQVDGVTGPVSGLNHYSQRQNYFGLPDGGSHISEDTPVILSAYTDIAGINQTLRGGTYCPWNGSIYAASTEGNVIGIAMAGHIVPARIPVGGSAGDNDPYGLAYAPPVGGRLPCVYWANRADQTLVKMDVRENTVLQTLDLTLTAGGSCVPYAVAYCPLNDKIYVTHGTTDNISIVTPNGVAADTVAQTLGGFADDVLAACWSPVNQKMYFAGVGSNVYSVTPTTTASDVIAQTLASGTITAAFGIAYCPFNRKVYVPNSSGANCHVIDPTTGATDSVLQTITLTVGGVSSDQNRAIAWFPDAEAMVILSGNSKIGTVQPSIAGTTDVCTQVQASSGGTGVALILDPKVGKMAELAGLTSVSEYS